MDVDSPLRNNNRAYIFISTHGEYKNKIINKLYLLSQLELKETIKK